MTAAETAGESVLTQPGAVEPAADEEAPMVAKDLTEEQVAALANAGPGEIKVIDVDPLNAAIAATAGDVKADNPSYSQPAAVIDYVPVPTPEEREKAMEAYVQAGVDKATAHMAGHEIPTVAGLRAALASLLHHLHLDHPENYLPKG